MNDNNQECSVIGYMIKCTSRSVIIASQKTGTNDFSISYRVPKNHIISIEKLYIVGVKNG